MATYPSEPVTLKPSLVFRNVCKDAALFIFSMMGCLTLSSNTDNSNIFANSIFIWMGSIECNDDLPNNLINL
jgi:hypothetical protein